MGNKLLRESRQLDLLALLFASQIATASNLSKIEKWAYWFLPLRSFIVYLALKLADRNIHKHWKDIEHSILLIGEPSIHTLSKLYSAKVNRDKLHRIIEAKTQKIAPWVLVEPCIAFTLLIILLGAIWPQ